jgi:hypothetical protein
MDPLSALSLAGTVIQFVNFGTKLLSTSVKLYKSSRGRLETHEELELTIVDLQSVVLKLRRTCYVILPEPGGPPIEDDQFQGNCFSETCDEAARIAEEILNKLKGLEVREGKHHAWESLKAAVRSAWSNDEILLLRQRLSLFKETLNSRLVLSIRYSTLPKTTI